MTLSLLALIVVFAALAAAAVLRRLPGAAEAAAGEVVCVRCGTPGRLLAADTFVCPVCRHDVRDLGVALVRPGVGAAPLWRIVLCTVVCAIGLGATNFVMQEAPRVYYTENEASLRQQRAGSAYRRVEFRATGRRVTPGAQREPLEGDLTADVFLTNGQVFTLEVFSPSLRYRVIDTAGREAVPLTAEGAFNESAVLQWLAAAGLDPSDRVIRALARAAYQRVDELLNLWLPPPPPLEYVGGYSTGGSAGGGGFGGGLPPYALPAAVAFWSVLWLAWLWVALRRRQRGRPPAPPREGVPA
jgi:hypothetical protein